MPFLASLLLALVGATSAAAETNLVVRSLSDLARAIDARRVGVRFDVTAVVTLCGPLRKADAITVQDGDDALFFWNHSGVLSGIAPGDRVRAVGKLCRGSRIPVATDCHHLERLGPGTLPEPIPLSAHNLDTAAIGRRLVRLEGIVTDAFHDEISHLWNYMVLDCGGKTVYVTWETLSPEEDLERFIGAEVSVTGCNVKELGLRQHVKTTLTIQSSDSIRILKRPSGDPFDADSAEGLDFLGHPPCSTDVKRSLTGFVLAVWDRNKLLLRTDAGVIAKGELATPQTPSYGDHVRLVGFPETDLCCTILTRAIWRREATDRIFPDAPPVPVTIDQLHPQDLPYTHYDYAFHGRTVRLRGIVRSLPAPNGDGRLYLESDSRFAIVDLCALPDAARAIDADYEIEVTGICVMETEKMGRSRLFPRITGFRIVPRAADDVRVLARPPWWTPGRLLAAIGALLLLLIGSTVWSFALRRLAERRGKQLAREEIAHSQSELRIAERTRLSVELHDGISQNITGACLQINAADQLIGDDPALARARLDIAAKTLVSCRNELRNCLWDLRSQALEETDMDAAIRLTLKPYVSETVDLFVRFNVPRAAFTDNTAHALMRIIRELVMNAIRHGGAKSIRIAGCIDGGVLMCSVQDDGRGFDPANCPGIGQGHFGIQGIRERIKKLDGSFEIRSARGAGTKATFRFTMPQAKGEKA